MNRSELCNTIVTMQQQQHTEPRTSTAMDRGHERIHPEDRPFSSLPFPWKVHELLGDAEAEGYTDIVSWMPGNVAFRVHKQKLFTKHIMPRYFKQTKYRSFRRQLNLWGFERLESGPNRGGYWNPNFVHQRPSLCHNMKRTEVKQKTLVGSSSVQKPSKQGVLRAASTTKIGSRPENPVSLYFKSATTSPSSSHVVLASPERAVSESVLTSDTALMPAGPPRPQPKSFEDS